MSERRYSEEEVSQIFEQATEAQKIALRPSNPTEGLTLAEIQAIGRDVGIPPELVAQAARSLERRAISPRRQFLGLPIGVGHTVELGRPLTEAEWQRLVVDLRETFDARGRLSDNGAFKQWTNGNLEVLLEPMPKGQRLRLRTLKGSAMSRIIGGAATLGVAGLALASMLARGDLSARWVGLVTLVAIGLGLLVPTVIQLPAWARLRQRQMEAVAERAALMSGADPEEVPAAE